MGLALPDILAMAGTKKQPGRIISRQKCPECGAVGQASPQDFGEGMRLLMCACGKQAIAPEIDLTWKTKRVRITANQQGERFSTLTQAEAALTEVRRQIKEKKFYPNTWKGKKANLLLFENYAQLWLKHKKARGDSPSTIFNNNWEIEKLSWFNGTNIQEIRTAHIDDFKLYAAGSTLTPAMVHSALKTLRAILNWAYEREDVVRKITVKVPSLERKPPKHLSAEQQVEILGHIPEADQPIFLFLAQYGCRPSEACGLCWDKIDLKNKVGCFARNYSGGVWTQATKTRVDRGFPIMGWFEGWLKKQFTGIGETPVFRNPKARNKWGAYHTTALDDRWRAAYKKVKFEYVELKNGTRHTLGYELRKAGADMEMISRVLGHSDTKTTRVYVEDDVALVAQALEQVERNKTDQAPTNVANLDDKRR